MPQPIRYTPWEVLHDVHVSVEWTEPQLVVILPWVCAADYKSLVVTCEVMGGMIAKTVLGHAQANNRSLAIDQMRALTYEPPLVRFKCEDCQESWDAWIDDEGSLEDQWSVVCTNSSCSSQGEPATLLPEES